MSNVTVQNTITGAVGSVPERLYNSSAFNKDDVWVLYDGNLEPDCGCNGQTEPCDEDEPVETLYEINYYPEEEVD